MPRLYLFAEGQTEQTFASNILQPHLANYEVHLHNPVLVANHREKGHVYRGGGRHYLPMKNDIVRFLKQEKQADVFFTSMIDLYAIHADFPGKNEADQLSSFPYRRVEALEAAFAADVGDRRFIPFIQLHEHEAYLFVDIQRLGTFYDKSDAKIKRLLAMASSTSSPELINDGPQTAPSKRIISEFPGYEHEKPVVAPLVAELIVINAIRAKCPHFNTWLSRLEQLGTHAT